MAKEKSMPQVVWAQRNDKLYVTINAEDCKNVDVKFSEKSVHFSGKGGEKIEYDFDLEFYGEIDPEKSKFAVLSRHIPMVVVKKEAGPYWPRLLKDSTKVHWLKTDFDKWKDEDDSDVDESKDMAFEDMMSKMGGMGGLGGMNGADMGGFGDDDGEFPENEEGDSDDEELPDLA